MALVDIDLYHYKTKTKITVLARQTGENQFMATCINEAHEDKTPSMSISVDKGLYHCFSCGIAGQTWQKYLENKGSKKSGKQYSKEKREKERKNEIIMSLNTDLVNWSGYDKTIKEECKSRIVFDLCFLQEREKLTSISSVIEAGIFKKLDLLDKMKKVESLLEQSEFTPEEEKEILSKQKFNPRPYSEKILSKYPLKFDLLKRFWIYHEKSGLWIEKAETLLNSLLRKSILGEKDYKAYCVREILEDLKGLSLETDDPVEPESYLIPFNNKIYDLKNKTEIAFSPEYFLINKLAVNYNSKASDYPTIKKVFREIVGEENSVTLLEIIAYCMWRKYPYPKVFFLFGSGANGKTAFIKILRRIIGSRNISSETSNAFQFDRFSLGRLYGKLANVTSEMQYSILKNTDKIKMATGEDLLNCERKFKEPFVFQNYAKLIFLTNQIPLTKDKTFAFYRRIFLLEFPNKFILGKSADPDVIDKIDQSEFEALALATIAKLKELKKKYFVFTKHLKTEEITEQYENLSNPLFKFVNDFIIREPDSDIPKNEFQARFNAYQKDKGFRLWDSKEVSREMKAMGYNSKYLTRGETREKETYISWIEIFWR